MKKNEEDQQKKSNSGYQIFVGAVNPEMTQEYFEEYFSKFGKIIELKEKFRGFGFVNFELEEARDKVLDSKTGHELMGKKVDIKIARSREETTQKLKDECSRKLYVTGVTPELTKNVLRRYFLKFGDIESIKVKYNTKSGNDFAFILFKKKADFDKAIKGGLEQEIEGIKVICEKTMLRDDLKKTQMEEGQKRRKKKPNKKSKNQGNKDSSGHDSQLQISKDTIQGSLNITGDSKKVHNETPVLPPQPQHPSNLFSSISAIPHQNPQIFNHYNQHLSGYTQYPQHPLPQQNQFNNSTFSNPINQLNNQNLNLLLYQYHQNMYNQAAQPPQHQPYFPPPINNYIQPKKEEEQFQFENPMTRFSSEHLSDIDNNSLSSHQPLKGFEPTRVIVDETQSEKQILSSRRNLEKKRDTLSFKSDYLEFKEKKSSELERERLQAIMDQDYEDDTVSVRAQSGKFKFIDNDNRNFNREVIDEDDEFVFIEDDDMKKKEKRRTNIVEDDDFLMGFKIVEKSDKGSTGKYVSKNAELYSRVEDKVVKSTWKVWDADFGQP